MAVVKKDSLTVVPASSITVVQKKKPQKILDEDTYTQVSLRRFIILNIELFVKVETCRILFQSEFGSHFTSYKKGDH